MSTQGRGGAGEFATLRPSDEEALPSRAHAASPRPLARTTRTRNESEIDFPVRLPLNLRPLPQ